MSPLETLKLRASKFRPDLPMIPVIDRLVQLWKGPGTRFDPDDMGLSSKTQVMSVFLLLDDEPLYVLRSQWLFVDGSDRYHLDNHTLEKMLQTSSFRHPQTGEDVPDYIQRIGREYVSGTALDKLLNPGA